jgi:hypothetical protein
LLLLPAHPLSPLAFRAPQITSFRGLNSSTTGQHVKVRCFVCATCASTLQNSLTTVAPGKTTAMQPRCKQFGIRYPPNESSYPPLTPISRLKQARPRSTTQTGSGAPAAVAVPSGGIKISLSKWVALGTLPLRYDSATFHVGDALKCATACDSTLRPRW